jgi:hypothetical protein
MAEKPRTLSRNLFTGGSGFKFANKLIWNAEEESLAFSKEGCSQTCETFK